MKIHRNYHNHEAQRKAPKEERLGTNNDKTNTFMQTTKTDQTAHTSEGTFVSRRVSYNAVKYITKTYLYNVDPLKPHFYIVRLGFTGVYIIFLISAQNIDCGYSLEPPRRGGSNKYPQSMFCAEI